MPRVGMARKGTKRHRRKHSRRCIFRYKHTRKQHRKQQRRQHGGVSYDPTTATIGGTAILTKTNPGITSVTVQGFPPMSVRQYKKMADDSALDPLA